MIDAISGKYIWAKRYDGDAAKVFTVQDMFVREIVKALKVKLTDAESKEISLGQTSNLSAREVFQKGWESFLRYTPKDNAKAAVLLKQAVKIDPDYGRAYAALSLAYLRGCQMRWNKPLGMSAGIANSTAKMYLGKTRDRPSTLANVAESGIELYNRRYNPALIAATRAISTDPNDPEGYIAMAWSLITTGKPKAALELVDLAMRLNPTHPSYYVLPKAMAHYTMGDVGMTVSILSAAVERDPGATELAPALAASYAQLGERKAARTALLLWSPGAKQSELALKIARYHFPYEWSGGRGVENRLTDGLQLANLPLDTTVASLVSELVSQNDSNRFDAVAKLALFGPMAVDAVPALIKALKDPKLFIRRATAITLGKIGPAAKAAIPALTAIRDERMVGFHAKAAIRKINGK